MDIEGIYFNIITGIYDRPTVNIVGENRNKSRMPTLATFI